MAGQSSVTHGYASGGTENGISPFTTTIDKFSFTADGDATNIGDITASRYQVAGQSSTTHGYASGGTGPSGITNIIDIFPFTSDTDATDIGNLTQLKYYAAGTQV